MGRLWTNPVLLFGATAALAGCRAPQVVLLPAKPSPVLPAPGVPADAPLTRIEPDYKSLPLVDPATDAGIARPPARGLTEADAARIGAERAISANLIQQEGCVPRAVILDPDGKPLTPPPDEGMLGDVRAHAAAEARNRSASESLIAFFQLADAEGRGDILRQSVVLMDQLKAAVKDAKAKGAKVPVEPEELDRQRASVLTLLGQAELGAKLLDVDLKRRLGLPGGSDDRLQPVGEFGMSVPVPEVAAAVQIALERRGDLQALRTVYLKLTPESLPTVRDYLRALPGLTGLASAGHPPLPLVRRAAERRMAPSVAALEAVLVAEVAVRRQQLWTLIEEKERGAADEVRANVASVTEQVRQVGLARWRAEQFIAKAAEARKRGDGPILEQLAEIEALRARADVIAAVMQWHQARVRLNTAQGLYATRE